MHGSLSCAHGHATRVIRMSASFIGVSHYCRILSRLRGALLIMRARPSLSYLSSRFAGTHESGRTRLQATISLSSHDDYATTALASDAEPPRRLIRQRPPSPRVSHASRPVEPLAEAPRLLATGAGAPEASDTSEGTKLSIIRRGAPSMRRHASPSPRERCVEASRPRFAVTRLVFPVSHASAMPPIAESYPEFRPRHAAPQASREAVCAWPPGRAGRIGDHLMPRRKMSALPFAHAAIFDDGASPHRSPDAHCANDGPLSMPPDQRAPPPELQLPSAISPPARELRRRRKVGHDSRRR